MHIPDGFLDTKTWVTATAASAGTIAYAVKKVNAALEEKDIPLMGVLAAFIFAAQLINFPVAGGTSGHVLGAALATILLGPWKAILVMFSVITVQALLFGDGGVTALGANVFNMAILGTLISHAVYGRLKNFGTSIASFIAGLLSILAASIACAFELGISGTVPLSVAIPMMAGWHFLIGIGEGVITAIAIGYLIKVRIDLVENNAPLGKKDVLVAVSVILFIAFTLSPFASALPDGLERVAMDAGFVHHEKEVAATLIPDRIFPSTANGILVTSAAGVIGIVATLVFAYIIAVSLKRRSKKRDSLSHSHQSDLHLHNHEHEGIHHRHVHFHLTDSGNDSSGHDHHEHTEHAHTHTHEFEIYSFADSPIHKLDARTKSIGLLAFLIVVVLTPTSELWRFALFALLLLGLYLFSGVPIWFGIKRSVIAIPFVLFAGILLVFSPDKPHPPFYDLGFARLSIEHGGLYILINALIKSCLSILTVILLHSTTPFPKLIQGLEALRTPNVITSLLSFLYRFMSVISDEVKTMLRARDARAFGGSRLWHLQIIGQMIGSLFIRTFERAERVYSAMVSRGYDGTLRTLEVSTLTYYDAIFAFILFVMLLTISIWRF